MAEALAILVLVFIGVLACGVGIITTQYEKIKKLERVIKQMGGNPKI